MEACSTNPMTMKDKETQIAEAKQWLKENAHTPWALMELELMEDYAPEKLDQMISEGTLLKYIQIKNEVLTDQYDQLDKSGAYNHQSEIGDIMRQELIEQYLYPENSWSVDELLVEALDGRILTEREKDFLRENLPPFLAREVDLLP